MIFLRSSVSTEYCQSWRSETLVQPKNWFKCLVPFPTPMTTIQWVSFRLKIRMFERKHTKYTVCEGIQCPALSYLHRIESTPFLGVFFWVILLHKFIWLDKQRRFRDELLHIPQNRHACWPRWLEDSEQPRQRKRKLGHHFQSQNLVGGCRSWM